MQILCLTSRLPYPPDRGDRLRVYHLLETLAPHHELTLVSFIQDGSERTRARNLEPFCRDIHLVLHPRWRSLLGIILNLWRREPLQSLYYRSLLMRRKIDRLLHERDFDAAYVHLFRMAQYVKRHSEIYRIADLTDIISREISLSIPYRRGFWRMLYAMEVGRIRTCEIETAETCEETWLISPRDSEELAGPAIGPNIRIVPNGVDSDRFRPVHAKKRSNHILFVGHLGVAHNVDAVRFLVQDILPFVWRRIPECTLEIAGAGGDRRMHRLNRPPRVTVTGFVEDLNGILNNATVFVAPLRFSAGIQNKVLEAMSAGLPVITTARVADGLEAQDGRELVVADKADAIAAAIVSLLEQPGRRDRLGRAAADFVRNRYRWDYLLERCASIENELRGSKKPEDL